MLFRSNIINDIIQTKNQILYDAIKPANYPGDFPTLGRSMTQNLLHGRAEEDPYSEDAWRMYLGIPQKYNTFSKSNYRPSIGDTPNDTYYKLPKVFSLDLQNLLFLQFLNNHNIVPFDLYLDHIDL